MQNFNDNPTKNQCIVHPHRQRNDHKLIDFSVDNNDICSKHQNQNNQTDNRTSSGLSTTNKSKVTKKKNLISILKCIPNP